MVVADRLKELASDKRMNIKEFASFLGVSERTIQNYIAGISLPNGRFLADLSEKTGASATWLLTGGGPKYFADHQNMRLDASDFVPIPRYAVEASAGHGALVHDEEGSRYYAFNRKFLERRGLAPNNLAVISVKGDSMEPDLHDGDLILLDMAQTEPQDSRIYAVRYNADLFVKRVMELPGNRIQLLSTNPNYPPITVDSADLDGIQIIGRVVNSTHEW